MSIRGNFLATLLATSLAAPIAAFGQATADITPAGGLSVVPREQTLVYGWSLTSPIGVTNPLAVPGYAHQDGNNLMWEPLQFYGVYSNKYIPWLANSVEYVGSDYKRLEIKLNPQAAWSDGSPVTSEDVVYTFQQQMTNSKLSYNDQFSRFVDTVAAKDKETVEVTFKIPAPRFMFDVLTSKFDTGLEIVPKSWESKQADVNAAAGGTEIPHSGPYDLVAWNANQKIYDLRPTWWAVKAGLRELPAVKRVVVSNIGGTVGQNMDTVAQRVVNNEMDVTLDMRAQVIGNVLAQNPKVTSWTGNKPPYGNLDWAPTALWFNDQLPPYNDVRVRKAIELAINRDQIDDLLYDGSHVATIYPFPLYPELQKFADSPAVKAEEAKNKPAEFDLDKSAQLMTEAGFTKNSDGLWEKDGKTVDATLHAFEGVHSDIAPILVELFRKAGFDAAINFGSDAQQNQFDGAPGIYINGMASGFVDPFVTWSLFESRFATKPGTPTAMSHFSRYSNPEFDKLVADMSTLPNTDPKFQENAAKAMGIYWRDVINIPLIQWLHRIPYNTTYWTNWPSETNVADGTNGAPWHNTALLVFTALKPATAQ